MNSYKHKSFLGLDYKIAGDCSIISFMGFPIYKRVGSAFSVFGIVLRRYK